MMLNYRIVMGLVCSSLAVGWALPGVAQQVVLTPAGTMVQPLPSVPVNTPMMTSPVPGVDGPTDKTPYVWVPVPGTGVDGNTTLKPEDKVAKITSPGIPVDPDAMVGGVRISDLIKVDKPSRIPTAEETAVAVQRGEAVYLDSVSSPTTFTSTSTSSPVILLGTNNIDAAPQVSPVMTTTPIASSSPSATQSIIVPKILNPVLLPNQMSDSDSPLSNSRLLPGFNQ